VNKEIATFSPVDPDNATDTYTYSLVTGTGGDNNTDFTFGTGTKSNQLISNVALPNGPYKILVQVANSGGSTFQKAFTVTVASTGITIS